MRNENVIDSMQQVVHFEECLSEDDLIGKAFPWRIETNYQGNPKYGVYSAEHLKFLSMGEK
jgi:hypothetical protein